MSYRQGNGLDLESLVANDEDYSSKDKKERCPKINLFGSLILLLTFISLCGTMWVYRYEYRTSLVNAVESFIPKKTQSKLDTDGIQSKAISKRDKVLLPEGCLDKIPPFDYGRHRVSPPEGNVDLVCCMTTKGALNIAVHPSWAPIGAENFLNMVRSGYFTSRVPLMRALKNFLIQFGLSSSPETQKYYETTFLKGKGGLQDDPQWLPPGPPGRKDEVTGTKRFPKGYLAYAGAGKNSRGTQLIIALSDNPYLGGGSPWEVPWGQLFSEESYRVLDSIYTGYVSDDVM